MRKVLHRLVILLSGTRKKSLKMARFSNSMYGARLFLGEKVAVSRPRARLGARPNQVKIKKKKSNSLSRESSSRKSPSRQSPSQQSPFWQSPSLGIFSLSLSLSLSKLTVTEDGQNDISMQQRMAQVIVRRIVRDFATTQFTSDVGWSYAGLTPCCHLQIPKKLFVVATHTHKYTHTHTHTNHNNKHTNRHGIQRSAPSESSQPSISQRSTPIDRPVRDQHDLTRIASTCHACCSPRDLCCAICVVLCDFVSCCAIFL